ncbi:hypothetical protein RKE29_16300 [Streptomyces sp. B1866]|uniref:hypothetical protein n=1 Tax=Streptomyces sp. B1866 TaxID=3075431 RepID=UPI002892079A|nr:hypothetical protein [Streptomyces sp. B1866]MDT3398184.1 hypothetical protein [Streptomyces sp. B1866]
MTFNAAQYTATIDKISGKLDTLSANLDKAGKKAKSTANKWYVPGFVAKALIWCANKIIELGNWILHKIEDVLKGASLPLTAYHEAYLWQEDVRGKASGIAGSTAPEALQAPRRWKGEGADAYTASVKGQPAAATQIETSADKVATALTFCATAGLAFYVAIGAILGKFIVVTVAAIAALGSVVFSWAGAGLIVEEAGVNSGLVIAAVSTLTAALGTQAQQMVTVTGEAHDNSAFPGGKWPVATA